MLDATQAKTQYMLLGSAHTDQYTYSHSSSQTVEMCTQALGVFLQSRLGVKLVEILFHIQNCVRTHFFFHIAIFHVFRPTLRIYSDVPNSHPLFVRSNACIPLPQWNRKQTNGIHRVRLLANKQTANSPVLSQSITAHPYSKCVVHILYNNIAYMAD